MRAFTIYGTQTELGHWYKKIWLETAITSALTLVKVSQKEWSFSPSIKVALLKQKIPLGDGARIFLTVLMMPAMEIFMLREL